MSEAATGGVDIQALRTRFPAFVRPVWLAGLIALVGVGETAPFLRASSFWIDEAATLSAAQRPFGSLWRLCLHQDAVLGAYYVILHGWIAIFGASEASVRTPSLIAYGVTIYLTVLMGCRLFGARAGVVAGFLCIAMPGLAWSALDARPTAIATATVTASMYALLTSRPAQSRRAWISGALLALGVLLQLTAVFVLAAQRSLNWRHWKRYIPVVVCLIPLIPLAVVAYREQAQVGWLPTSFLGNLAAAVCMQFVTGARSTTTWVNAANISAVVLGVILLAGSLTYIVRTRAVPIVTRWAYLPALLAVTLGLVGVHLYNDRYFAICAPGLALTLGASCQRLRARHLVVLAATVSLLAVPSIVGQRSPDGKWGENLRQTAAFIAAAPAGAPVIYLNQDAQSVVAAYPSAIGNREQVPHLDASWTTGALWAPAPPAATVHRVLQQSAGHAVVVVLSTTAKKRQIAALHLSTTTCHIISTNNEKRTSAVLLQC